MHSFFFVFGCTDSENNTIPEKENGIAPKTKIFRYVGPTAFIRIHCRWKCLTPVLGVHHVVQVLTWARLNSTSRSRWSRRLVTCSAADYCFLPPLQITACWNWPPQLSLDFNSHEIIVILVSQFFFNLSHRVSTFLSTLASLNDSLRPMLNLYLSTI